MPASPPMVSRLKGSSRLCPASDAFSSGVSGLTSGPVEESGVPVDHGQIRDADLGLDGGRACRGIDAVIPETAMARMEAVAIMVAPVFLIRQGSANCWRRSQSCGFRGEDACGADCGVACAGVASGAEGSASCAAAEWLAARASARTNKERSKRRGRPARKELPWFAVLMWSKPRPAKRWNFFSEIGLAVRA